MGDEKLRELERRWRDSGSTEDEAAYLRERVRTGDLSHERLALLAYLGHPAALMGLTEEIPAVPRLEGSIRALPRLARDPAYRELAEWVWGLAHWNATLVLEATGQALISSFDSDDERDAFADLLAICRQVWRDPSESHQEALRQAPPALCFEAGLFRLATLNQAVGYYGFMGGEELTRAEAVEQLVAMALGRCPVQPARAAIREALVPLLLGGAEL